MSKPFVSMWVAAVAVALGAFGTVPQPAWAIELGDWVVTIKDSVPMRTQTERVFVLAKDTELVAGPTQDKWVDITVIQEGDKLRGWVEREALGPLGYQSEMHRQTEAMASVPPEKRYIAFSLGAARRRIGGVPGAGLLGLLLGGGGGSAAVPPEVSYLGGMTCVRGLVVDPDTGDAIVVGQYRPGRQRLTLDDLVVALRARFVHAEWPVVSIDPPSGPRGQSVYHNVRFEGGVGDTAFGYTLFEADYLLKKVGQGHVPTGVAAVPSHWQLWVEQSQRRYGRQEVNISGRVWFFPELAATPVRDNVAAYSGLEVGVYYEILAAAIDRRPVEDLTKIESPTGEQFVSMIRRHYNELSAMHPSWRRIKQLNELVALSRAVELLTPRPDFGWWLDSYPITSVQTPRQVPELSRSQTFSSGRSRSTVTQQGGVQLRAMALRLEAGDVSALADAVLAARPAADALTWVFLVDEWVIPVPPELDVTRGAEVTPQLVYAQFLTRQGKYEEALSRLDRLLAMEPNYIDALQFKGTLLSDKLDRQQEAIECFDAVLKKTPDSVEALVGRGLARAKTNNTRQARDDFDKALGINPRHVGALAFRGLCREQRRDYEGALSDLDEALRLDPTIAIAYVWRGNIHRRRGDDEKALHDFGQAIQNDDSLAWAYACRGDLQRRRGESDKALTDLTEAIRLDPDKPEYYLARAEVGAEKGNASQAITDYTKVLEHNPDHNEARWQRSELYLRSRQFDKAWEDCKKLNLLLLVEVTENNVALKAGNKTVATVNQRDELQVLRVDGKWLWVETLVDTGDAVQGWLDQEHVRSPQPVDDDLVAPPVPPAPPAPPVPPT